MSCTLVMYVVCMVYRTAQLSLSTRVAPATAPAKQSFFNAEKPGLPSPSVGASFSPLVAYGGITTYHKKNECVWRLAIHIRVCSADASGVRGDLHLHILQAVVADKSGQ